MSEAVYQAFRSFWVVWLMILFIGIVAWAYWPSRRRKLEDIANIPLRDEEET